MKETISSVIKRFFKENNWVYNYDDEYSIFVSGLEKQENYYKFFIVSEDEAQVFLLRVCPNFNVSKPYQQTAMEYLSRVNYRLNIGCLKMDMDDGEISMDIAADFEDGRLTSSMLSRAMIYAVKLLDRFMPGIRSIVLERKSALVAYEEVCQSALQDD